MTGSAPTRTDVLSRGLLADGRQVDITVTEGRIAAIAPASGVATGLDLGGRLVLPAFVEPHAHLDKALVGPLDATGDLDSAIAAWVRARPSRTVAETLIRARTALAEYVRHGTGAVRTHVDVADPLGPAVVSALAALRQEVTGVVDLQIVAMPATPLTGRAAADTRALLVDAIAAGADLIGGAPWIDENPRAALDLLLDVGAGRGLGVDLHVDETLDPGAPALGHLLAAVEAGFDEPVTASHAVSLGQLDPARQRDTAQRLAHAGIAVVANPRSNLWLQDRRAPSGARRGLTAVRALVDAGVSLAAGGDNLRDPFTPYGAADPLAVAQLLVLTADVTAHEALTAVTGGALLVLRGDVGVRGVLPAVGDTADLVIVPATGAADVVARAEPSRLVLHRGHVVSSWRLVDESGPGSRGADAGRI